MQVGTLHFCFEKNEQKQKIPSFAKLRAVNILCVYINIFHLYKYVENINKFNKIRNGKMKIETRQKKAVPEF